MPRLPQKISAQTLKFAESPLDTSIDVAVVSSWLISKLEIHNCDNEALTWSQFLLPVLMTSFEQRAPLLYTDAQLHRHLARRTQKCTWDINFVALYVLRPFTSDTVNHSLDPRI